MKKLADEIHLTCESVLVDENPNMSDMPSGSAHYKVKLRARIDGRTRSLTTFFSMGPALCKEPEAVEVLDCLVSDAAGIENARDFTDWAQEYGYDPDSRKAEKIYRVCVRQSDKLAVFLGPLFQRALYKTERV